MVRNNKITYAQYQQAVKDQSVQQEIEAARRRCGRDFAGPKSTGARRISCRMCASICARNIIIPTII